MVSGSSSRMCVIDLNGLKHGSSCCHFFERQFGLKNGAP